jgi:CHASE2 domain-containing sensor protein
LGKAFFRKIYNPHALIITALTFLFIWVFQIFFFSRHFLDPFNNGLRDYEITDIVYSQFRDPGSVPPNRDIVLLNTGLISRDTLAELLTRVRLLEPAVVALDIELDGRKDSLTDARLKAAIDSIPRMVLASRLIAYDREKDLLAAPAYCDPYFSKGRTRAFTNFVSEDTSIIRLIAPKVMTEEGEFLALAVESVRQYAPDKVDQLLRRENPVERIWYSGTQDNFFKEEASRLLSEEGFRSALEQGMLRGKILLMGYIGNHELGEPEIDRFFTPLNPRYTGKSYPDMYGLEIHANIAAMVLNGTYIHRMNPWVEELVGWIFCYINVLIFYWIYIHVHQAFHGITRLVQLLELVSIFFIIALFFHQFRVQITLSHGILAMLLSYDVIMIYESLIRKRIKILNKI